MVKCEVCKIEFPDHLVSPFVCANGEDVKNPQKTIQKCCPMCALRLRNKMCGLPHDTTFQGEMASMMYDEAKEYLKKRKVGDRDARSGK